MADPARRTGRPAGADRGPAEQPPPAPVDRRAQHLAPRRATAANAGRVCARPLKGRRGPAVRRPANDVSHAGALPSGRSGRHMILAVWTINDTGKAFYQCSDVNS
ncbi:lytic polysaccharide monooxygenase [Kribbella sp. CWNU-51]